MKAESTTKPATLSPEDLAGANQYIRPGEDPQFLHFIKVLDDLQVPLMGIMD